MVLNVLLTFLFVGMLAHHGLAFARYHRPYRVAYLAFWGVLLFAHVERREDLYLVIALLLVVAVVMKACEPAAIAGWARRELERTSKPTSHNAGVWDREVDGP